MNSQPYSKDNKFKKPIEKSLQQVDKEYYENKKELDLAKDSLSQSFYQMRLYDIFFNDLIEKHSLIRAYLYQFHKNLEQAREKARKLYAYLDNLELKEEYLVSSSFVSFLDYYLEYINRIATGKDIPTYLTDKNFHLANGLFEDEVLKFYLYQKLNYGLESASLYPEVKSFFHLFIQRFPNTVEAHALWPIYNKHKNLTAGQKAPTFTLYNYNGNSLNSNHLKGKVIIATTELNKTETFNKLKEKFPDDLCFAYIENLDYRSSKLDTVLFEYEVFPDIDWPEFSIYTFTKSSNTIIIDKYGNLVDFSGYNKNTKYLIEKLAIEPYSKLKTTKILLEKYSKWINFILTFLFAFFIAFFSARLIKLRKQKTRQAFLQSELKAIRSQLNPHFLFNALSSIQNFITNTNIETANKHLTQFATLMRQVLDFSQKETVSLEEEMQFLTNYLELEALRYEFKFQVSAQKGMDIYNLEMPSVLLQPFVENAIVHAMSILGKKGKLSIDFLEKENQIIVTITDNGPGIPANPDQGFGLKSCTERIELLNSQQKENIKLQIVSPIVNMQQGTQIILNIPKKY